MKNQVITKSLDNKISQLKELVYGARASLKEAGKLIIQMLDENENAFDIILASDRNFTIRFLESLELVGRGKLDPLLLTDPSPAAQRALSQSLPIKQQEELINKEIPIVRKRNGGFETVYKSMQEITKPEADVAIRNGQIQPAAAQEATIREQEATRAVRQLRYRIDGETVHFFHDSEFTYEELVELCDKVAPKAKDIEASIKKNQVK